MFAAIGRSFRLIKESYHVLRQDPELIWLTVASFIGVAFVVGVLGGFGLSSGAFETATAEGGVKGSAIVLLALGLMHSPKNHPITLCPCTNCLMF